MNYDPDSNSWTASVGLDIDEEEFEEASSHLAEICRLADEATEAITKLRQEIRALANDPDMVAVGDGTVGDANEAKE